MATNVSSVYWITIGCCENGWWCTRSSLPRGAGPRVSENRRSCSRPERPSLAGRRRAECPAGRRLTAVP